MNIAKIGDVNVLLQHTTKPQTKTKIQIAKTEPPIFTNEEYVFPIIDIISRANHVYINYTEDGYSE